MTKVVVSKKNEVFLKIDSEPHVYQELSEHFSFDIEGAKYMNQYRKRYWDGKIRLFSTQREAWEEQITMPLWPTDFSFF